jgi:hypothetical protein
MHILWRCFRDSRAATTWTVRLATFGRVKLSLSSRVLRPHFFPTGPVSPLWRVFEGELQDYASSIPIEQAVSPRTGLLTPFSSRHNERTELVAGALQRTESPVTELGVCFDYTMKIRFLAVAALLSYTTGAFAGGPLPPQIQAELTAMSSASTFAIAGAQEVPFHQKLHRPINRREVTEEERNAAYQQAISDELSFVESQRNRVVTLTEQQRKALITLLLDNGNYVQNTSFTVGAPMTCGVDVQSESMKLTIVFHGFFVSVFTPGRKDNGLFNDRGKSQLREWIQSTVVDANS